MEKNGMHKMNERHYIYILPMGNIGNRLMEALRMQMEDRLSLPLRLMKSIGSPEYAFNSERGQYHSLIILRRVLNLAPGDAIKMIGLCNVDLYIPIRNFIFGQAQVNGVAAVVSLKRLNEEFYGKPFNEALLFCRTLKEVMHELGHTFGLGYCTSPGCVMSHSIKVEHVDHKEIDFCDECRELILSKIDKRKEMQCWAKSCQGAKYWWWMTRKSCASLS
jgi:archaemetzincin